MVLKSANPEGLYFLFKYFTYPKTKNELLGETNLINSGIPFARYKTSSLFFYFRILTSGIKNKVMCIRYYFVLRLSQMLASIHKRTKSHYI